MTKLGTIHNPRKGRPRIEAYDDERAIGNSLIITLSRGWRFEDMGEHVRGFDTKREAALAVNNAKVCECHQCVIARGRPRIEDRADTIEARKPWLAILDAVTGKPLSRRQWYRRQKDLRALCELGRGLKG